MLHNVTESCRKLSVYFSSMSYSSDEEKGSRPDLPKKGEYMAKDGWRKVVELQERIQIAVSIVDAWDGFYHSVQIKSLQPLQLRQQSTSTFLTSLFRIEPKTYKHQYKESNHTAYSDSYWKTTKEIACKADRKNSFCQVTEEFSNMFLTLSQNLIHWLKYSIGSKLCQETYADVAEVNRDVLKRDRLGFGKIDYGSRTPVAATFRLRMERMNAG